MRIPIDEDDIPSHPPIYLASQPVQAPPHHQVSADYKTNISKCVCVCEYESVLRVCVLVCVCATLSRICVCVRTRV